MPMRIAAVVCLTVFTRLATAAGADAVPPRSQFEKVPPEEAAQIERIVKLTVEQLKSRYPGETPFRRGVHPKDHGCVQASFKVNAEIPERFRVGVFAEPGRSYEAWIRFSNAAVTVGPDSTAGKHGSRGMAIKLMGVSGTPLLDDAGPVTQDFLMVNHPVFAFANVEDYEALSQVLLKDKDKPDRFFAERIHRKSDGKPDMTDAATRRALKTLQISQRIQSPSTTADPPAFQGPPASPVDNSYFSAAPYLFGKDMVMKYSAVPLIRLEGDPSQFKEENYLRAALLDRLNGGKAGDVVFDFRVQVRTWDDLKDKLDSEIEDATTEWAEDTYPFVSLATITIKKQNFDTEDRRRQCESLSFTPWHGITEHQPIGGINRLKLGVYQASSFVRHKPKEPAGFETK